MNAPNPDITLGPIDELHALKPDRSDRFFFKNDASMRLRPSFVGGTFRASTRFLFAALVGIGGTLAWQSYGDEARDLIRAQAPSLAEWLPPSSGKPVVPPIGPAEAQQQLNPAVAAAGQQPAPIAPELQRQLEPITVDLAAVRQTIEQLTANQEKMVQSIARLEKAEQGLSQKLSSLASPKPVVHAPPPKPVQHPAHVSAQAPSRPLSVAPPSGD